MKIPLIIRGISFHPYVFIAPVYDTRSDNAIMDCVSIERIVGKTISNLDETRSLSQTLIKQKKRVRPPLLPLVVTLT